MINWRKPLSPEWYPVCLKGIFVFLCTADPLWDRQVTGVLCKVLVHLPTCMQDVTKHQKLCAKTLGIPQHKLVSKTKRLGGGFGGKETRSAFLHCVVAVAGYHMRQPVKLVLPRQQDMQMTGHRHAFMGRYKVAAAADGRLLALDLQLYANAGGHHNTLPLLPTPLQLLQVRAMRP